MGDLTKRGKHLKRLSQAKKNVERRKQRVIAKWRSSLECFEEMTPFICNKKGKKRTYEENKFILLALKACLRRRLEAVKKATDGNISWDSIEEEISSDFKVKKLYVRDLRRHFFEHGEIEITEAIPRGFRTGTLETKNTKVTSAVIRTILDFIHKRHADNQPVTASMLIGHIFEKKRILIGKTTIARTMKMLGKQWHPIKPKKRTFSSQHQLALRAFLIKLDAYIKHINAGNTEKLVFVFTDESYIHQLHTAKFSYLSKEERTDGSDRKTGKGRRLIILHAITPDGPLCERDDNGYPVDDLVWKKDTPHPNTASNKLTCETLWMSNSHTGDYHDNMNSDMFMQWVTDRLCPTFEKLYPGHKMVLLCDNAPYHHKRDIGSLGSKTKAEICELMVKYNVEYVDLPCDSIEQVNLEESADIQHRGEVVRVGFSFEEQQQRSGKKRPTVASSDELKLAFVSYLKECNPGALKCKVEEYMTAKGYEILWTPPYCPDLQPIERYWACGKNHVAWYNYKGSKMEDVIFLLREGWYGTKTVIPGREHLAKQEVDCGKLWAKCLVTASDVFVKLTEGINGVVGDLSIDKNWVPPEVILPIDTLIVDLTKYNGHGDEEPDVNDADDAVVLA